MEPLNKLKKGGSNQEFMITVNCPCIINLMYEVVKLAKCGSHGFSSDVRMRILYMVTCFITF